MYLCVFYIHIGWSRYAFFIIQPIMTCLILFRQQALQGWRGGCCGGTLARREGGADTELYLTQPLSLGSLLAVPRWVALHLLPAALLLWLAYTAAGWWLARGSRMYMGLILGWSAPIMAIQWLYCVPYTHLLPPQSLTRTNLISPCMTQAVQLSGATRTSSSRYLLRRIGQFFVLLSSQPSDKETYSYFTERVNHWIKRLTRRRRWWRPPRSTSGSPTQLPSRTASGGSPRSTQLV